MRLALADEGAGSADTATGVSTCPFMQTLPPGTPAGQATPSEAPGTLVLCAEARPSRTAETIATYANFLMAALILVVLIENQVARVRAVHVVSGGVNLIGVGVRLHRPEAASLRRAVLVDAAGRFEIGAGGRGVRREARAADFDGSGIAGGNLERQFAALQLRGGNLDGSRTDGQYSPFGSHF